MPVFSCKELQLLQRETEKNVVKNLKEKVLKLHNSGKISPFGGIPVVIGGIGVG